MTSEAKTLAAAIGSARFKPRQPSGRYDHERMDKVCRCGWTLGKHDAAHPHPRADLETGNIVCTRFVPNT